MAQVAEGEMRLACEVAGLPPESVVFGRSPMMQTVRHKVEKVAGTNVPVLIQGESGTGKEIIAKLLHHHSPWNDGPFVKVNCPAIPATLLESELFGYEKGAFTGAYGTKPGRVEMAHRGTLFLDEIGELDIALQAKLLQLLQDGQFSRIGAQEDKKVEVRLVCATNRKLDRDVEAGSFRRDLFYRINVVDVQLPPLRDRREDIADLVDFFLAVFSAKYDCSVRPISGRLLQLLTRYDWPGNIRQLENLIRRYVILGVEEALTSDLIDQAPSVSSQEIPADGRVSLKELTQRAVTEVERRVILKTLQTHHWNRRGAAKALNISYRALLYKIRQAGLPSARARSQEVGFPTPLAAEA